MSSLRSDSLPIGIAVGLALVSFSSFILEIILTRIFSVTLWYHFGAITISLALLGLSASGVCCYLCPIFIDRAKHVSLLCLFAALFALTTLFSTWVHLGINMEQVSIYSPYLYILLAAQLISFFSAFFSAGTCFSIVFLHYGFAINRVYAVNLLSSALGCLGGWVLLSWFSPLALVFFVAALALFASFAFHLSCQQPSQLWLRGATIVVGGLALGCGYLNDSIGLLSVLRIKSYFSESFQLSVRDQIFEQWGALSRIAVFREHAQTEQERMWISNDGGAHTELIKYPGPFSERLSLENDHAQLVHQLRPNGSAVIIGAGGGRDVLSALLLGRAQITAVEINPIIAHLVQHEFADYIGHLFSNPRVKLVVEEGRHFFSRSEDQFDVIQISMVDSWLGAAAGAYIFNENTLYTQEGIYDALKDLRPEGVLSITRYYPFYEMHRLVNLIVTHLEETGVRDFENRFVVLRGHEQAPWMRGTLLYKHGEFSEAEIADIRAAARRGGHSLIYAPRISSGELAADFSARLIQRLIRPATRAQARNIASSNLAIDITAPSDDRPFFFFINKSYSFRANALEAEHPARRMALALLYGSVIILSFFALAVVALPLIIDSKVIKRSAKVPGSLLLFVVAIGFGFMMIEIAFFLRLTVFLGHATYSLMIVLTTLLLSSGLGSLFAGFISDDNLRKVLGWALVWIILLLAGDLVFINQFNDQLISQPLVVRIFLAVLLIALPGVLLGVCFPTAIHAVRKINPDAVPWVWAINSGVSVLGSLFAFVLALHFGLQVTMLLGMLCYLLCLLILSNLKSTIFCEEKPSTI